MQSAPSAAAASRGRSGRNVGADDRLLARHRGEDSRGTPRILAAMTSFPTVRVAAIQATPVILDAAASVEKAVRLLGEAAGQGAQLAVLPETFLSLYPSNAWATPGRHLRWLGRAVGAHVEQPATARTGRLHTLVDACRRHHPLRNRGERARERAPGHALQRPAAARARRVPFEAPQADATTHQEKLFHGIGAGDDLGVAETRSGVSGA